MISKEEAYLIGLICGRGHILQRDKKIIIEFAHKNKIAYGIAYCKKCGGLATDSKSNDSEDLNCKLCGKSVPKSVKKVYEQRESTINSLNEVIIPFLSNKFKVEYDTVGNDHMTLLILDFSNKEDEFEEITNKFNSKSGFDSFEIPKELNTASRESKIEFVNGLLDTSGFFNAGSWLIREGESGFGVMRGYFQIVRNWKIPVQICDFLYKEFKLTIQTIDWGHPNMRDQADILAWAREHQVKFFPEDYGIFKLRVKHKQEMFQELIDHNKKIKFTGKDVFSVSRINKGQIKPYHPAEKDPRLPPELKGKHFDASWQIAYELGSEYIAEFFKSVKNKKVFYLTGKDEDIDYKEVFKEFESIRKEKTQKVEELRAKVEEKIKKAAEKRARTNPEQKLYAPVSVWLEKHFSEKYGEQIKFSDTSSFYLHKFMLDNNLYDVFESYEEYRIKPDLVGFLLSSKKIILAEVKVNEMTLKDLGQLRGYCLVSKPELAILISKKEPSITLKKLLKTNKEILSFNDGRIIQIGVWDGNKLKIMEF
ncbi:MAG: hypothetical protein KKB88_04435 [Nanoarchaeota archaeon]|nr:hypothetical protein [Nanoarchaeota archaeon]